MTAPELLTEHLEPNPDAKYNGSYALAYLERTYSLPGLRPVKVRICRSQGDKPWSSSVHTLRPTGWDVLLVNRSLVPQDDNGEAEADRLAALAGRLQEEAGQ